MSNKDFHSCNICGNSSPNTFKFCPWCGNELSNCSDPQTKLDTLPKEYKNPYGLWKVMTEGDAEGKHYKELGIFQGFIDEIAYWLSGSCAYTLVFKLVSVNQKLIDDGVGKPKRISVYLKLPGETYDIPLSQRVKFMSGLLKDRNVRVTDATGWYGSVDIIYPENYNPELRGKKPWIT